MMRALLIGTALFAVSVFGIFAGAPAHDHHSGCPFAPLDSKACVTLASHITHWQSATHGIQVQSLVFVLAAVYVITRVRRLGRQTPRIRRYVLRRPSLMQSLFADGILHPKAP